ncbi:MAG TPA: TonB-dependent receptor [Thermoanaerobaculia bacterium]|nr:TonB-dependent receptor [Thermoanaerobaculia bacterium]
MRSRISSALFIALTFLTLNLFAQTTDTASVRGAVSDAAGARVSAATITLENIDTGVRRETTSDARGEYSFGTVPVTGTWRIRIAKSGFADSTHGPFTLRAGETATLNAIMNAETVSQSVTVFGTAEGVRSDSPELGTRLDDRALELIPVFGRKLTSLPLLNSAVRPARGTGDLFLNNTLFVVNGGGRRQTTYTLDGSTGDDAWGRQTIFTNVPLATVREFTVLTNAFSAEYGRTTGGAINLITRSGTNEFMGDVTAVYRPKSLQANAPVTDVKAGDELKQISAMFSGPIAADRTHFLVGFERNDQDRESRITSPLAPGTFTGDFNQTLAVARLDQELGAANHLVARANLDRFTDTNPADAVGGVALPSAARTFHRSATSLQLSDTMIVNSSMFNEARFIVQRGSPITQFTPANPSTQFVRPGVSTEGESRSAKLYNHQWQLADTITWTMGEHSLRAGGDYLHSRSGGNGQEFGSPFVLGQFTFKTGIPATTPTANLTIADVARYTQGFGNVTYEVTDDLYAAFVQDDFRPLPSLTLNLGLRYDRQKLTGDNNNFAPRLGFNWNADSRTAVRGGYGVYFSQIRSNIVASWELAGPLGFFNFSAAPGQLGFPTSLQPLPAFPAGAVLPPRDVTIRPGERDFYSQFFDVSKLRFYPDELRNPRTQQETLGFERQLLAHWFLSADAVYAHTTGIEWNLDANAPSAFERTTPGQIRSAPAADATRPITPVAGGYRRILVTTNNGESKYRGLQLNVRRTFDEQFGVLASYTWSHATNNVEADAPGGDPNDVNLRDRDWADSILDQRHRGVVTVWRRVPFDVVVGAVATAASGRPFNITTGADNNGDAANTDRPVIDGAVVGRNAGEGSSIFSFDAFVEKAFRPRTGVELAIRAEAFNLTNHTNVVGRNGVYGNTATPPATFGTALGGINSVDPARQYQFEVRARF